MWYVEIRRDVYRSLKTRDAQEARALFKTVQREALAGKLVDLHKGQSVTLEKFIEEYMTWCEKNRANGTCERAAQALRKFQGVVGSGRTLMTLRKKDMENYIDFCRSIGNKPTTVNIDVRQIKAAFSKAIDWEYFKENPFSRIKQLQVQKAFPVYLNEKQIQKVTDVIGDNRMYRLMFALFVYTGGRREEVQSLNWADIKKNGVHFNKTKTYRSRVVPISPRLREILEDYPRGVGRMFDVSTNRVSKVMKAYFRKAGVGHIRLHDLRHTFASQLVQSGINIQVVQELLGHTSYSTTLIYAHLSNKHLVDAINKLPY
jgi:integrase